MALRPIFIVSNDSKSLIKEMNVNFKWEPGYSKTQKQKSILSLHKNAKKQGINKILEISTKSPSILGNKLSAFNLKIRLTNKLITSVESAYQGSKIFQNGGPFKELYNMKAAIARKDKRLHESGKLVGFEWKGVKWRLNPLSSFYDWLYIQALWQNKELSNKILKYNSFTDIEFNPKRQVSCQARSAAYYVSLVRSDKLEVVLSDKDKLLDMYSEKNEKDDQIRIEFS